MILRHVVALVIMLPPLVTCCPLGCTCTKQIASCESSDFDSVPRGFPDHITELTLLDNKIQQINSESFPKDLPLVKIDLAQNQISQLAPDTFVTSDELSENNGGEMYKSLKSLSLRTNRLSLVPTKALDKLRNLEELSLARNRIKLLKSQSFVGMSNLVKLNLSSNSIGMIATDAFEGLHDLESLDLSSNALNVLSPNMLGHLSSLKQLILSRNGINKIHPLSFDHFPGLCELRLDTNKIRGLEDRTFATVGEGLENLNLARNQIKKLTASTFRGIRNLHTLELSHNLLSHAFEDSVTKGIFSYLTSLKKLKLDSNRIEIVTSQSVAWQGLYQLRELSLAGNLVKSLPSFYPPISFFNLESLDLSSNLISTLNRTVMKPFPTLRELKLSDNVMNDVSDDAFADTKSLRSLYFERNHLQVPHWSWFGSNRHETKPTDKSAFHAHLAGNPWLCDCRTMAFARHIFELNDQKPINVDTDVMVCDQPEKYKGQNVTSFFMTSDLHCDDTATSYLSPFALGLCGVTALIVILLVMLVRFYRLKPSNQLKKPFSKYL